MEYLEYHLNVQYIKQIKVNKKKPNPHTLKKEIKLNKNIK